MSATAREAAVVILSLDSQSLRTMLVDTVCDIDDNEEELD